jgi:secreted PhoX family phosphatase
MRPGDRFEFKWVNVKADQARSTAREKKATIFHRCEGIWFFDGQIYFTATSYNQLFKLTPRGDGGTIELLTCDLESPDNVTVAPWGDIVVAEDQKGYCRLRLVSSDGTVRTLAKNSVGPRQELAGVCFSPSGKILFCNLQKSGQTLAITGPFQAQTEQGA